MIQISKILIYHKINKQHKDYLTEKYNEFNIIVCTEKNEMKKHIEDSDILITFKFNDEMLDMAKNIKWIQALSAGVEKYPLDKIREKNVILTNGRGIHKIYMAEYAICIMIVLARNLHVIFKNNIFGKWDKNVSQGEIYGATLGIIGLGSIGLEIAKKAKLMGMHVIGVRSSGKEIEDVDKIYLPENMEKVFKESDYIINLLPSVESTYKIIDKNYFNLMKTSACFINMGRGNTVNEEDLVEVLRNKKIKAFASDVFSIEPLPKDSPFWRMENVIITPHICGESNKYFERALPIIENNIKAYKGNGGFINLVSFEKGY